MKDEKLSSIDESLVAAGQFLEEIVTKKQFLHAFVQNQEIVTWLRSSTKSIMKQHFVYYIVCKTIHFQVFKTSKGL